MPSYEMNEYREALEYLEEAKGRVTGNESIAALQAEQKKLRGQEAGLKKDLGNILIAVAKAFPSDLRSGQFPQHRDYSKVLNAINGRSADSGGHSDVVGVRQMIEKLAQALDPEGSFNHGIVFPDKDNADVSQQIQTFFQAFLPNRPDMEAQEIIAEADQETSSKKKGELTLKRLVCAPSIKALKTKIESTFHDKDTAIKEGIEALTEYDEAKAELQKARGNLTLREKFQVDKAQFFSKFKGFSLGRSFRATMSSLSRIQPIGFMRSLFSSGGKGATPASKPAAEPEQPLDFEVSSGQHERASQLLSSGTPPREAEIQTAQQAQVSSGAKTSTPSGPEEGPTLT